MAYGKCFLCGKYGQVERHHAFPGALRDKSEEYGLTVDLCALECHREGKKAVHKCKESRLKVQKYCQKKAMREQGWSVEDFIREFGRNYLEPEEMENVSLPQSPTVTAYGPGRDYKSLPALAENMPPAYFECVAPSSEGAFGSGELFGFRLLEPVALFI